MSKSNLILSLRNRILNESNDSSIGFELRELIAADSAEIEKAKVS